MKKSTISVAIVLLLLSNGQSKQPPAPSSHWLKIDPKGQIWQSRDGITWTTSSAQVIYKLADGSMLWKQDI